MALESMLNSTYALDTWNESNRGNLPPGSALNTMFGSSAGMAQAGHVMPADGSQAGPPGRRSQSQAPLQSPTALSTLTSASASTVGSSSAQQVQLQTTTNYSNPTFMALLTTIRSSYVSRTSQPGNTNAVLNTHNATIGWGTHQSPIPSSTYGDYVEMLPTGPDAPANHGQLSTTHNATGTTNAALVSERHSSALGLNLSGWVVPGGAPGLGAAGASGLLPDGESSVYLHHPLHERTSTFHGSLEQQDK